MYFFLILFLVFQDFKVSQDKTGQTRVGDLSAEDMKKVRRLVLIEMSAMFDTCGIEVKAHKALKVKVRGQCSESKDWI